MYLVDQAAAGGLVVSARYGDRALVICAGCAAGLARMQAWRGMPPAADAIRLATLRQLETQTDAIAAAVRLIRAGRGWLTLAGGYGAGKTTLIYAVMNELADRGVAGRYTTAPALLGDIRAGMNGGASSAERLAELASAPLLAIDELDKYHATSYADEQLFMLLDARYSAAGEHITLLAFNIERQDRIAPYALSRMRDGRFAYAELGAADLRPQLAGLDPWDRGE